MLPLGAAPRPSASICRLLDLAGRSIYSSERILLTSFGWQLETIASQDRHQIKGRASLPASCNRALASSKTQVHQNAADRQHGFGGGELYPEHRYVCMSGDTFESMDEW